IYGGVGLGKTHLMHAVGHRAMDQRPETSVLYVSSEKFTNDLIKSIMGQRTDEFRDRYRSADILMIDDIQFIAGKEATQEEFFHTFNDLFQSGRQIIVSSDRPPKAIPTLAERLRSRFEGGLIVDVQPPDIETRTAILSRKGQSLGVHVPSDVLEYVARKVQSNIRELEGALNKIIALAQLFNAPIRMEIAIQALNDAALEARRAQITPERVLDEVTRFYKATLTDLRGRGRSKEVVLPRQVAMYVLREETGSSLVEIGALLGGRDHSTVMHGIAKIEREIETNTALRQQVSTIREALYAG
ncbi:MAG TPA: chromosomal replication initiator protein DnaA, partial [Thermomicrobiales bacterium]|nr:chromosomal replication initiator protein DnaA [Thermomicrobiales bacterium]